MEQYLYIFIFLVSSAFFIASLVKREDYQKQGMYGMFATLFFIALAFQSFNIETIAFSPSVSVFNSTSGVVQTINSSFSVKNFADDGTLAAFFPFGICLIISIFSFLNTIIIFMYKGWNAMLENKPYNKWWK